MIEKLKPNVPIIQKIIEEPKIKTVAEVNVNAGPTHIEKVEIVPTDGPEMTFEEIRKEIKNINNLLQKFDDSSLKDRLAFLNSKMALLMKNDQTERFIHYETEFGPGVLDNVSKSFYLTDHGCTFTEEEMNILFNASPARLTDLEIILKSKFKCRAAELTARDHRMLNEVFND